MLSSVHLGLNLLLLARLTSFANAKLHGRLLRFSDVPGPDTGLFTESGGLYRLEFSVAGRRLRALLQAWVMPVNHVYLQHIDHRTVQLLQGKLLDGPASVVYGYGYDSGFYGFVGTANETIHSERCRPHRSGCAAVYSSSELPDPETVKTAGAEQQTGGDAGGIFTSGNYSTVGADKLF